MTTHEQRIISLEDFRKQVAAHIREVEENTTIMLGVMRSQGQDIKRLVEQGEHLREESANHTALLHMILSRLPDKE